MAAAAPTLPIAPRLITSDSSRLRSAEGAGRGSAVVRAARQRHQEQPRRVLRSRDNLASIPSAIQSRRSAHCRARSQPTAAQPCAKSGRRCKLGDKRQAQGRDPHLGQGQQDMGADQSHRAYPCHITALQTCRRHDHESSRGEYIAPEHLAQHGWLAVPPAQRGKEGEKRWEQGHCEQAMQGGKVPWT